MFKLGFETEVILKVGLAEPHTTGLLIPSFRIEINTNMSIENVLGPLQHLRIQD